MQEPKWRVRAADCCVPVETRNLRTTAANHCYHPGSGATCLAKRFPEWSSIWAEDQTPEGWRDWERRHVRLQFVH